MLDKNTVILNLIRGVLLSTVTLKQIQDCLLRRLRYRVKPGMIKMGLRLVIVVFVLDKNTVILNLIQDLLLLPEILGRRHAKTNKFRRANCAA